jgi:hypothetical protein
VKVYTSVGAGFIYPLLSVSRNRMQDRSLVLGNKDGPEHYFKSISIVGLGCTCDAMGCGVEPPSPATGEYVLGAIGKGIRDRSSSPPPIRIQKPYRYVSLHVLKAPGTGAKDPTGAIEIEPQLLAP